MSTELVTNGASNAVSPDVLEAVLLSGDLAQMPAAQRLEYYLSVCRSLGLNPSTRPFDYLKLNGKTVLYAKKDATEQLRKIRHVSLTIVARECTEGVYVVTTRAVDGRGRTDESIGAVPIEGLKGESRANAMMKAETKSKRRVTLSICGLGMLDETEIDSIQGAQVVELDAQEPLPVAIAKATFPTATVAWSPSGDNGEPITPGTEKELKNLVLNDLKWPKPRWTSWAQKQFGVKSSIEMSEQMGRDSIDMLKVRRDRGEDEYRIFEADLRTAGRIKPAAAT